MCLCCIWTPGRGRCGRVWGGGIWGGGGGGRGACQTTTHRTHAAPRLFADTAVLRTCVSVCVPVRARVCCHEQQGLSGGGRSSSGRGIRSDGEDTGDSDRSAAERADLSADMSDDRSAAWASEAGEVPPAAGGPRAAGGGFGGGLGLPPSTLQSALAGLKRRRPDAQLESDVAFTLASRFSPRSRSLPPGCVRACVPVCVLCVFPPPPAHRPLAESFNWCSTHTQLTHTYTHPHTHTHGRPFGGAVGGASPLQLPGGDQAGALGMLSLTRAVQQPFHALAALGRDAAVGGAGPWGR
jgi:hypothetical protein